MRAAFLVLLVLAFALSLPVGCAGAEFAENDGDSQTTDGGGSDGCVSKTCTAVRAD